MENVLDKVLYTTVGVLILVGMGSLIWNMNKDFEADQIEWEQELKARTDWCEKNGGMYFRGWSPHCEFPPK